MTASLTTTKGRHFSARQLTLMIVAVCAALVAVASSAAAVSAPSVTAVSPTSGKTAGGTRVTVTGAHFRHVKAVKFGIRLGSAIRVLSATTLRVTSPPHAAGTVNVRVVTAYGTSASHAADHFTYVAPPNITAISPTSGKTAGGTTVTITGTGLGGATTVKFGADPATSFTVNSASQISAVAPAGTAGTVDITVTTTGGTSAASNADQYTYVAAPTVTDVAPHTGSAGQAIVITGTGFLGATTVNFGANTATFTIVNDTQLNATAPDGSGVVDVTVTSLGGTSAKNPQDEYFYT